MTRAEQIRFITELTANIRRDLIEKIDAGRIPDTWDGHELRELLAEHFGTRRSKLMLGNGPRKRHYDKTVLVENL